METRSFFTRWAGVTPATSARFRLAVVSPLFPGLRSLFLICETAFFRSRADPIAKFQDWGNSATAATAPHHTGTTPAARPFF
jgi:hypothetical protein